MATGFALVDRFPLVPIYGERHLNQAIAVIDELTGREALAPGESSTWRSSRI